MKVNKAVGPEIPRDDVASVIKIVKVNKAVGPEIPRDDVASGLRM